MIYYYLDILTDNNLGFNKNDEQKVRDSLIVTVRLYSVSRKEEGEDVAREKLA